MTDLENVKRLLLDNGYTCVLAKDFQTVYSTKRGVKPLLELLESGRDYSGFLAADKVVGKAAAFLYVLLDIKELYAGIISKPALAVLREHKIETSYDTLVEGIRNRTDTGYCPMETAVLNITDPQAACEEIRKKLEEFANKS